MACLGVSRTAHASAQNQRPQSGHTISFTAKWYSPALLPSLLCRNSPTMAFPAGKPIHHFDAIREVA
jgi:hypothetical protein